MDVSVIIPVYNAEKYLSQAIDSALAQPEVREVILIEDHSPDNALGVCEEYVRRDERVKLLQHPSRENRGAGASRNLGIRNASSEYVAFLDADDQYVPERFRTAREIFATFPDADGVYGHIGTIYYDPDYKELHLQRALSEVTGMLEHVQPDMLLCQLLRGNRGHVSVDSLVVKREILTGEYLFDETLRQRQDTDFMYRLAGRYRLYAHPGVDIVALRGVHRDNRVFKFSEAAHYEKLMLQKCIRNRFYGCKDRNVLISVIRRYLRRTWLYSLPFLKDGFKYHLAFVAYILTHPFMIFYIYRQSRNGSSPRNDSRINVVIPKT